MAFEAFSYREMDNDTRFGLGYPHPTGTRVVLATFWSLLTILGVVGNIAVFIAVIKVKILRTRENMFTVNLAIIDLALVGYTYPFITVGVATGWYPVDQVWCRVNYAIMHVLFTAESVTLFTIAVNRYTKVCHVQLYHKVFTKRATFMYCALIWAIAVVTCMDTYTYPSIIVYQPVWYSCYIDSDATIPWALLILLALEYPIIVVLYCKIISTMNKVRKRLNSHGNNMYRQLNYRRNRSQVLSNLIIFIIFVLLPVPLAVQTAFFPNAPAALETTFLMMLCLNSSINCVIYGLLNKNVIRAYKAVLPTVWLVRPQQES